VTISPTATLGSSPWTLTVNAPDQAYSKDLGVTMNIEPPVPGLTFYQAPSTSTLITSIDLGTVVGGRTYDLNFYLRNTGDVPLTGMNVTGLPASQGTISIVGGAFSLAVGVANNKTVKVTISPTATLGSSPWTLTVNAPDQAYSKDLGVTMNILDNTPPILTKELTGTVGLADWYTSNVEVTLTGDDPTPGSGLNRVEYSLDGTTWATYTVPFTISTEGTTTLYHRAYDNAGNVYILPAQEIKIDKTMPVVTVTLPDTGLGIGVYLLNEVVSATWSASDAISGVVPPATGIIPIVDTSSVGPKTLTVPAGTVVDYAGNPSAAGSANYSVVYAYSGILPPINPDGSSIFKLGSTVPVKFQLRDASGNVVTNAVARISVALINGGVAGTEMEAVSTSAATTGNLFRYSSDGNQYIFNLATKGLSTGTWRITITLDDGTSQTVNISLR